MNRDEVRREVRRALDRELSQSGAGCPSPAPGSESMGDSWTSGSPARAPGIAPGIVTERDIHDRIQSGDLHFPAGTRFTSLARETLDRHQKRSPVASSPVAAGPRETVAVGADHGGFELKEKIALHLRDRGFVVLDCGTFDSEACDYPLFARAVAESVKDDRACAGIIVDGAGIGSAMTANKVPGIRAAHCHNVVEARNAREHNHAHVVTLGAGMVGPTLALAVVDAFLATPFGAGRHARRVQLIEHPQRVPR